MALDLKAPENIILKPTITVFGVGGAGGNAINNMMSANLQGANFVVANTDAQALKHSLCENRIQLGVNSTQGLGAGASPAVGREAAEESEEEIRAVLAGSNMVFVTAGMGGGTGTGASPVIARIARELGILTVGVVTKPFLFEGSNRMRLAEGGLAELHKHVDTLIVIPNQNLFRIANEDTTFADAFKMADEVLHAGVRGVTDLITMPGLINLDFADIKTVMSEMGKAMMGTGEGEGQDRAIKAAEAAISNPLLDQSSMCGAKGVLINITGGKDMTLYEVDSAANRIREEVGQLEANIIFGSTLDANMSGTIRVSVVATGIDQEDSKLLQKQMQEKQMQEQQLKEKELEFAGAQSDLASQMHKGGLENFSALQNIKNIDEQLPPSANEIESAERSENRGSNFDEDNWQSFAGTGSSRYENVDFEEKQKSFNMDWARENSESLYAELGNHNSKTADDSDYAEFDRNIHFDSLNQSASHSSKANADNISKNTSAVQKDHPTPVKTKKSFLKRMWNSLKSGDSSEEDRSLNENNYRSDNTHIDSANNGKIQEVPDFLRKK